MKRNEVQQIIQKNGEILIQTTGKSMQEDACKNNDNTGNMDHLFHTSQKVVNGDIYCNMSNSKFLTKFVYEMRVDSICHKKRKPFMPHSNNNDQDQPPHPRSSKGR